MGAEHNFARILACNRHREGLQLGAEGCEQIGLSYQTPQIPQGEVFSLNKGAYSAFGLLQDGAFCVGVLWEITKTCDLNRSRR
jgi:hypothetical protein